MSYTRIGHLKTIEAFRDHLATLGLDLPDRRCATS